MEQELEGESDALLAGHDSQALIHSLTGVLSVFVHHATSHLFVQKVFHLEQPRVEQLLEVLLRLVVLCEQVFDSAEQFFRPLALLPVAPLQASDFRTQKSQSFLHFD